MPNQRNPLLSLLALLGALLGAFIFTGVISISVLLSRPASAGPALEVSGSVAAQQGPSAADIANARGRSVIEAEVAVEGASISTTTVNLMDADGAGGNGEADVTFSTETVQNLRFINTHASQHVCGLVQDRANGAESCNTVCAAVGAGALTCTGSGTADGIFLPGGTTIPFTIPIRGDQCFCGEASAASTTYNLTRIARAPNH